MIIQKPAATSSVNFHTSVTILRTVWQPSPIKPEIVILSSNKNCQQFCCQQSSDNQPCLYSHQILHKIVFQSFCLHYLCDTQGLQLYDPKNHNRCFGQSPDLSRRTNVVCSWLLSQLQTLLYYVLRLLQFNFKAAPSGDLCKMVFVYDIPYHTVSFHNFFISQINYCYIKVFSSQNRVQFVVSIEIIQ